MVHITSCLIGYNGENGRQETGVLSAGTGSTYSTFRVLQSHELLYLSWDRTDLKWGTCIQESYFHILTIPMALPWINLCLSLGAGRTFKAICDQSDECTQKHVLDV